MKPGAARNAVDCALWDLEAKASGRPVWQLAGLAEPKPVEIAFTLSLDTPEKMREAATRNAHRAVLKVKLGTPADMPRIEAVRSGAPNVRLIVDANEGWTPEVYTDLAPHLIRLGVEMVEQPLPRGQDAALEGLASPIPLAADESCTDRGSLPDLLGRYQYINIKLDKCGGLTEAWAGGMHTHLGITVAGFPELYLLLGPNTGLGHNSVVLMIEAATRYVLDALDRGRSGPRVTTASAQARFTEEMLERSRRTVWATGCRSWYLDLTLIGSYFGSSRVYHHTAPINMVYALDEALALVFEEGLAARHAREIPLFQCIISE